MGCKLIDRTMKRAFFSLGHFIGRNPLIFVIAPILLTGCFATGLYLALDYEYDPEYLFSPEAGEAKIERDVMTEHFPVNYTSFKSSRIPSVGKFGRILVAAKDGGSMLRTGLWNELLYIDQVRKLAREHFREEFIKNSRVAKKVVGVSPRGSKKKPG